MTKATSIPAIFSVLAVACACLAEHPLDQAAQALAAGDHARAAELYQQANAELPTAEGYNNLGVALESCGRFDEAVDAYRESLRLPGSAEQIRSNLKRACVRALIHAALPYAASIFAGLLTIFFLIWLIRRLERAWRIWRFRMKYRNVRVASLVHRVHCRDGQDQPDGKAYPDSESISVKAELSLPDQPDIYPLHLELEVVRPNGAIWRTLHESIDAPPAPRLSLWFQLDQVAEMLTHSGSWKTQLILRNTGTRLASTSIAIVTRTDLIADLQASDVRLIALHGDKAEPESVIFPDIDSVVPTAVIRPKCFHPSKFVDMRLRLDLANVDKREEAESAELPLQLIDGRMMFSPVSRPIAGDEIARKLGRWEFRLSVDDRQLTRIPFVITSLEQVLAGLKLESFEIAGIARSGQRTTPVGKVAYLRDVRALCPVVTLTSDLPSPRAGFHMTMGVCVDGDPVGGVEGAVVLDGKSVQLLPGEFVPPELLDGRESIKVSFIFILEGRTLGIREVVLRSKPPRCADAQGRIAAPPAANEIDYDAEAARILQQAAAR
ncbi:MAG: hypothetical protein FLDDKLPJ_02319 [Phycisphaerae bacterium]|nr:hypothetical protein [Phycisphaerae bacterium]